MLRSKVAALRSSAAFRQTQQQQSTSTSGQDGLSSASSISGTGKKSSSLVRSGFAARGQTGRKHTYFVKTIRSFPMQPPKQRKEDPYSKDNRMNPILQERILQRGVNPSQLFDVLQGKNSDRIDSKRKAEEIQSNSTTRRSKVKKDGSEEDENDMEDSLLNSPLFTAYAHMETEEGEVIYGRWPSDSGCTCIESPVMIGPEFDVFVSVTSSGTTFSNTALPLLYASDERELIIRPKRFTFATLFSLLRYSGVLLPDIYTILSLLIFSLLKEVPECKEDEKLQELSKLVSRQRPEEGNELWNWPSSLIQSNRVGKERIKRACSEAASFCGMKEEESAWYKMLSTIRGRRYFFHRELQQIEELYNGSRLQVDQRQNNSTSSSLIGGLLRLNWKSLEALVKVLTEGDPFKLCFYKLSPVCSILPELPSVSYRSLSLKKEGRISVSHLTAVVAYQEVLKRDAYPLYQPRQLSKEALAKLSWEERCILRPVYYVHSQDKREGAELEDDSGHAFTHLSTLIRLLPSPQYDVLSAMKVLATHRIVAIAPALCISDNEETERHIYLRHVYQQTLDLVAGITEIEKRAILWNLKPPQRPEECVRYMMSHASKLQPSPDQQEAIQDAVAPGSPGIVLTGCAGTGKTATCARIAAHYDNKEILACALTGRASEILNSKVAAADTAHYYYYSHKRKKTEEHAIDSEINDNQADEEDEDGDKEKVPSVYRGKKLLIVDEGSLMPLWLLSKIIRDMVQNSRVHRYLICGDPDQLPSVEAGCVLADWVAAFDVLDKERAGTGFFQRLHRLAICHRVESKEIFENAMAIKSRNMDELSTTENFVILESTGHVKEDAGILFDFMVERIGEEAMKSQFHIQCSQNNFVNIVNEVAYERYWRSLDNAEDRRNGTRNYSLGFGENNTECQRQSTLSGTTPQIGNNKRGKARTPPKRFRNGCRIFAKKNVRDLQIKNGQILTILSYQDQDKTSERVVEIPTEMEQIQHQYDKMDLIKGKNSTFRRVILCKPHDAAAGTIIKIPLDRAPLNSSLWSLAYCSTGHKVQGTEFEHSAVILTENEPRMVTSAWLYTTMTRAKRSSTFICSEKSLRTCISRPPLQRLSDVTPLLIKAIRELRATLELGLDTTNSTPETTWWSNKANVKPFTAYPNWNQNVPKK